MDTGKDLEKFQNQHSFCDQINLNNSITDQTDNLLKLINTRCKTEFEALLKKSINVVYSKMDVLFQFHIIVCFK